MKAQATALPEETKTGVYRVSPVQVRGGVLIGYSVLKPGLGEEAFFMVSRYSTAQVAKRHAQNLCDRMNGNDGWDEAPT